MYVVTLTASPNASVIVQDPRPTDGRFSESLEPSEVRVVEMTDSQFDNMTPVMDNLVAAGFLTYTFMDGSASAVVNDSSVAGASVADALDTLGAQSGGTTFGWVYKTDTADADPGAGNFRLNNADPSLATFIYINKLNSEGLDVSSVLDELRKGVSIGIDDVASEGSLQLYECDADSVASGDYYKLEVVFKDAGPDPLVGDALCDISFISAFAHAIGGDLHEPSTLAQFNLKISDATLDKNTDPRTPINHGAANHTGPIGNASQVTLDILGTPTYTQLKQFLDNRNSASLISGFEITDAGGGAVNIAAGTAYMKITNDDLGELVSLNKTEELGFTLPDDALSYIYLDYNSGTPIVASTTDVFALQTDLHTRAPIGTVYRLGTEVHISNVPANYADIQMKSAWRLFELYQRQRASGMLTSETGNRYLSITAGVLYFAHWRMQTAAVDTSAAGSFTTWYNDGAWQATPGQTQIGNTQYNDYGTGLALVANSRYGVHWLYMHDDGDVHVVYGQGSYTFLDATEADIPANMPPAVVSSGILIAKIIVERDATNFDTIIYPWTTAISGSSVNSHNALAGLNDGDYKHLTAAEKVVFDMLNQHASDAPINGFPDRSFSTISFDDGSRTFTIAPTGSSFSYYADSILYTKTAAPPNEIVIDDAEGLHFIYYDGATLSKTTAFTSDLVLNKALIAIIYWDATNKTAILIGDERHGTSMSPVTHLYHHLTQGTVIEQNGLALTDIIADGSGSLDTSAEMGYAGGAIWDEDLRFAISAVSGPASIPVLYKDGAAGNWRAFAAAGFPVRTFLGVPGNRLAYNIFTGGSWQQLEVPNNDFMLTHIFATNDPNTPVIAIQGENFYGNISAARNGAEAEMLAITTTGLPIVEFQPLATLIYECKDAFSNTPKAIVRSTGLGTDYIDWRHYAGASIGGISAPSTDYLLRAANDFANFALKVTLAGADNILIEDSAAGFAKKYVPASVFLAGGAAKEVNFYPEMTSNDGYRRVRAVGATGNWRFDFCVPADFNSLVSLDLIGYPVGDFTDQNIDLFSDYGGIGEDAQQHTESDTTTTFSGVANQLQALDISGVFTNLAAGDDCGVWADHKGLTTTMNYTRVRLVYT
jgi:hypothetical protein